MKKKSNTKSLDQFVNEQYGKRGTAKREKLEKGYKEFRLGALIPEARLEKEMIQASFVEKYGTDKSYIYKAKNNVQ